MHCVALVLNCIANYIVLSDATSFLSVILYLCLSIYGNTFKNHTDNFGDKPLLLSSFIYQLFSTEIIQTLELKPLSVEKSGITVFTASKNNLKIYI